MDKKGEGNNGGGDIFKINFDETLSQNSDTRAMFNDFKKRIPINNFNPPKKKHPTEFDKNLINLHMITQEKRETV
jgi:hypothetical protein